MGFVQDIIWIFLQELFQKFLREFYEKFLKDSTSTLPPKILQRVRSEMYCWDCVTKTTVEEKITSNGSSEMLPRVPSEILA